MHGNYSLSYGHCSILKARVENGKKKIPLADEDISICNWDTPLDSSPLILQDLYSFVTDQHWISPYMLNLLHSWDHDMKSTDYIIKHKYTLHAISEQSDALFTGGSNVSKLTKLLGVFISTRLAIICKELSWSIYYLHMQRRDEKIKTGVTTKA